MAATIKDIFPLIGARLFREERAAELSADMETFSTAIDARVSVYPRGEHHPLAVVFGAFDDEPFWDDWMRAINEYREEENSKGE